MKRGLTLIIFLFGFLALNAQEVKQEQRTLLTKKTATWCPFCGQWGWSFMKNIMDDNEDKAVILGAHYSGDLRTPAAVELTSMFGGGGQPLFYADGSNLRVNSGNTSAKRTEVRNLVDANFNTAPVVNAGLEVRDSGGDLEIDVKAEFFQATSGTYKVAVWVLENDVVNNQAGQGPNAQHPFVLQEAVNGVTGEEIASGSIAAGTIAELDLSLSPDPSWNMDNLSFAAVIWKENGADHEFVNVYSVDDIQISTSTASIGNDFDFGIRPSILRSYSEVVFSLDERREISIVVHDLIGSEVSSYPSTSFGPGEHRIKLDRRDFGGKGMYMVSLRSEGQLLTKRLLVE